MEVWARSSYTPPPCEVACAASLASRGLLAPAVLRSKAATVTSHLGYSSLPSLRSAAALAKFSLLTHVKKLELRQHFQTLGTKEKGTFIGST